MVKELYQTILRETSLNVTSGEIDSIRKKSITKSGCRVYRDGFLGIAGTLGEPTANVWAQGRGKSGPPDSLPLGVRRPASAGPAGGAPPWTPVGSSSFPSSC